MSVIVEYRSELNRYWEVKNGTALHLRFTHRECSEHQVCKFLNRFRSGSNLDGQQRYRAAPCALPAASAPGVRATPQATKRVSARLQGWFQG